MTAPHPSTADATTITVPGTAPYDVVIGTGLTAETDTMLGAATHRVGIVHPPVMEPAARRLAQHVAAQGRTPVALPVPDGESSKDAAVLVGLWSRLADAGFTRTDTLVAIGGGATTDLAGFAAASWLRGVRVILIPSTLLGMVDAAIGGKTAINLPQGKNLVGAFHPPAGVLCDLDLLAGLDRADYVSGLAEIIKAGFIADPRILTLVGDDPEGAAVPHGGATRELIERAIRVKAAVVGEDLHDRGVREFLNYGHTLGHAVERTEHYRIRHGHAVSIGMTYAAQLSYLAGHLTKADVDLHRTVLEAVGLPTTFRRDAWPQLREAFVLDKKTHGDRLRFVVLEEIGRPRVLPGPSEDLLTAAFAAVAR